METYLKLPFHESSAYIISLYCTSLNLPTIQVVKDPILESKVINTAICKVQFSTAIFVEAPKISLKLQQFIWFKKILQTGDLWLIQKPTCVSWSQCHVVNLCQFASGFTRVIRLPTQTMHCYFREIPQNYHRFALFIPLKMGPM